MTTEDRAKRLAALRAEIEQLEREDAREQAAQETLSEVGVARSLGVEELYEMLGVTKPRRDPRDIKRVRNLVDSIREREALHEQAIAEWQQRVQQILDAVAAKWNLQGSTSERQNAAWRALGLGE